MFDCLSCDGEDGGSTPVHCFGEDHSFTKMPAGLNEDLHSLILEDNEGCVGESSFKPGIGAGDCNLVEFIHSKN